MKISILAFDLADNATGRADLLARLLAPRWPVQVVGPQSGAVRWGPAQGGDIEYRSVPAGRYPGFARQLPRLLALADGDLLYACKPRPTSFGVSLLARRQRRRPLVLDIDDWELGFFLRARGWSRIGRLLNLANPNGMAATWLMERLTGRADAVTVASRFLQARFGGVLVPHVRDTDAWDPARFDGGAVRARLGLGAKRVVMFLGTPRRYKGLDDLVEATAHAGPDTVLVLVGVKRASTDARRWGERPHVRLVGEVPFEEVPHYLAAADVVAVPQRATPDTVGQVPAKLFDAMALARPVVTTAVSMIPEIVEGCGLVVPPGDVGALRDAMDWLLARPEEARALGERARARCRERYSFTAARATLFPLVEGLLERP